MEFVTAYGPKKVVEFATEGESLTKQSMKDDADINFIIKQFDKTGVINHRNQYEGDYGDYSEAVTFDEAMRIVADANSMFETVPAKIRKQFGNDPGRFVEFVNNPENREELVKMGLAVDRPPAPSGTPDGGGGPPPGGEPPKEPAE